MDIQPIDTQLQTIPPVGMPVGMPNVVIPQPFSLGNQDASELAKLTEEINEKVKNWESSMGDFFEMMTDAANSWRMIVNSRSSKKPKGLFNSKSGETNRAVNTLGSIWFRMLTANDPFFEAIKMGLNNGKELTEEDLYAVEGVMLRQLQVLQFKRKLKRSMTSLSLMGTVIAELPFVSRPYNGSIEKQFEGTDFVHRSLLQTGFDPFVFDLDLSDYIFTIDYPTKYKLRQLANGNEDLWNTEFIEKAIDKQNNASSISDNYNTGIYGRIIERKNRAGYANFHSEVMELISYHGKLDSANKVLQNLWESLGRTDDMRFTDWTMGTLNGENVVRLHPTPFGTWHHLFKVAHYNEFELEPIAYGVGKTGRKYQSEIDFLQSQSNNALTMAIYTMWKVGKYAGLKADQLNIKPFNVIELEDINQMEQIKIDLNTIIQSMAMQGMIKEDFRAVTGATANLQAVITKATATEASLTQNESIRGASVIAEIIAETFIREYLETSHINNTEFLDNDIWVEMTGEEKRMTPFNRYNLPKNVGFKIKTVTDKDFRPERLQALLQAIQVATSVRQSMPESMNVVRPLTIELFRTLGISPRLLQNPIPVKDQLQLALEKNSQNPAIQNEVSSEVASEQAGGSGSATLSTPMGEVPTSPLPASSLLNL